jgi:CDP-glucose 4,6-dehydratase
MDALLKTYKGKRVLVTGHTGFKGSWLCTWLKMLGADVIGYALAPYTRKDNFVLSGLSDRIVDLRGDVRNFRTLKKVFDKHEPEFVFHLAAQSLVRTGYDYPKETFDVNVGGTINVVENCRLSGSTRSIVIVTSDKCYRNREWVWGYRENDELGGYDPYSSSKACAELVTESYRNAFFNLQEFKRHGKAIASGRAGNVIGGGDWREDRIVPDIIRCLEGGKAVRVRNPQAIRPWQFVLEPLGGYLLLAARMYKDHQTYSGAWNFGPASDSFLSVGELVETFLRTYGSGRWYRGRDKTSKKESSFLLLDAAKARAVLGWRPKLSVEEAVGKTVE